MHRIRLIRAIPLFGKAYADWPSRFSDLEQTRTLVEVVTDTGLTADSQHLAQILE